MDQAYAFFDCRASKRQIEAELPTIRELVKTPSRLELSLDEKEGNIEGDSKLKNIAKQAGDANIRYVMKADYPNATNNTSAVEMAAILNQAYQTDLYTKGEPFRGEIRKAA